MEILFFLFIRWEGFNIQCLQNLHVNRRRERKLIFFVFNSSTKNKYQREKEDKQTNKQRDE